MVKSKERPTEYCVIVMPWYREHPPICYRGYAKDESEAVHAVCNLPANKEVLDVKKSSDIEWNAHTAEKYWNMYGKADKNELAGIAEKLF